jgi:hypothetical protein
MPEAERRLLQRWWTALEVIRWVLLCAAVSMFFIALASQSFGRTGIVVSFVASYMVYLHVAISSKNLRTRKTSTGFVPSRVPYFTRWGWREPVIPLASVKEARVLRNRFGHPFAVAFVVGRGRKYELSLDPIDEPEGITARLVLEALSERGLEPVVVDPP